jgi:hypothetical protein
MFLTPTSLQIKRFHVWQCSSQEPSNSIFLIGGKHESLLGTTELSSVITS